MSEEKYKLTEAQQEIYETIEKDKWYGRYDDGLVFLKNVQSQCRKMEKKGFLESRVKDGEIQFKKNTGISKLSEV